MKKVLLSLCCLSLIIALISWGATGHKTVAKIAENHLTANTKLNVQALLAGESMSDVASWADGLRNDPNYSNTSSWHYINTPLGLSYEEFSKTVKAQVPNNVYGALLKCEDDLKSTTATFQQKADALKFIIHFVGDMHQPMHVSRSEDKGGNSIQLQLEGKGTNLHSLWDSGLINKKGETFDQMAIGYDKASPKEIKDWQSTDPMRWAYESYQISTKLYAEAEKDNKPGDAYFQQYLPIVQQRIEMAGIRLAGILNDIFKNQHIKITSVVLMPPPTIGSQPASKAPVAKLEDVKNLMGQAVTVSGKVYSIKDIGGMILINLGAAYPNQLLTVALEDKAKEIAMQIADKTITVEGTIIDFKGKPEIIVTDPEKIAF